MGSCMSSDNGSEYKRQRTGSRATRRASSVTAGGVNSAISNVYKHTAPGTVGHGRSRSKSSAGRRKSSRY